MKDKTLYAVILFAAVFCLWMAFKVEAAEQDVVVGAAPDPYEAIWQQATEEEMMLIAQVVWYESARCECPEETNIAVVETILNRVLHPHYPNTIKGVITQRGAFYRKNTTVTSSAVMSAIQSVKQNGPSVLPSTDYVFFATKKQSLAKNHVWIGALTSAGKPRKGKGMYFGEEK